MKNRVIINSTFNLSRSLVSNHTNHNSNVQRKKKTRHNHRNQNQQQPMEKWKSNGIDNTTVESEHGICATSLPASSN